MTRGYSPQGGALEPAAKLRLAASDGKLARLEFRRRRLELFQSRSLEGISRPSPGHSGSSVSEISKIIHLWIGSHVTQATPPRENERDSHALTTPRASKGFPAHGLVASGIPSCPPSF